MLNSPASQFSVTILKGRTLFARLPIIGLVLATLAVQVIFWIAIVPTLISPPAHPFETIEVSDIRLAEVEFSDDRSLSTGAFEAHEPTLQLVQPGYYLVQSSFQLDQVPERGVGLIIQGGADNQRSFVNGQALPFKGSMRVDSPGFYTLVPSINEVPRPYLREGFNTVSTLHVVGYPARETSFVAPLVGEYEQLKSALSWRLFLRSDAHQIALVMGFVLALSLFVVMLRSRDKLLPFWLFMLTLSWSVHSLFFRWPEMPFHGDARLVFYSITLLLLAVCWPIFVDAWTTRGSRHFRIAMVAVFLMASLWVLIRLLVIGGDLAWSAVEDVLDWVGLVLMLVTLLRLLWHFISMPNEKRIWEAALLLLLASLLGIYLFNTMFYDRNVPYMRLGQPMILLAFAVMFFSRNFQLFRSAEQINSELAEQLDHKTLALEQAHQREKLFVRQQAHDEERRRLMRDMHDGLGSQLMALLVMARKGNDSPQAYEKGIQQVIEEMRLMLNSLDSVGDNLETALQSFRKMIEPRITSAGFTFDWNNTVPRDAYPDYDGRQILQVFRILQEAVTNALKHSGGSSIRIVLEQLGGDAGDVAIHVSDDGRGFNPSDPQPEGHGFRNMKARASSIGADIALGPANAGETGASATLILKKEAAEGIG